MAPYMGLKVQIVTSTGTRLGFPTNILGPRTARVGFRFDW